jgi:phage tail P2-like protein
MADALLLPPPLAADERCRVLAQLAARLSGLDLSPVLVQLVDAVDASALPYLAEQFNVLDEGWQYAINDTERRRMLRSAIDLHRHKGTRWAVEKALDVLGIEGQVLEWFEYDGEPYRFRVDLVSDHGVDAAFYGDLRERALALIEHYKNVRSVLEGVRLVTSVSGELPFASAVTSGEVISVQPFVQTDVSQEDAVPRIGLGMTVVEVITVDPAT